MIGGSYGGQIQFAAASVDPRIDTIVPLITWDDLSYPLGPNNTSQTSGVSTSTPGATKLSWGLLFSGVGVADGLQNAQGDPSRLYPCVNFADFVCPALATAGTTGYFQPSDIATLRHASVVSYLNKIRIPVLLAQGENDTLFNLNEAVATYKALLAQHTAVKMIWQSWGHSQSTPAPGELSLKSPTRRPSTRRHDSRPGSTTTSRARPRAPDRTSPTSGTGKLHRHRHAGVRHCVLLSGGHVDQPVPVR